MPDDFSLTMQQIFVVHQISIFYIQIPNSIGRKRKLAVSVFSQQDFGRYTLSKLFSETAPAFHGFG